MIVYVVVGEYERSLMSEVFGAFNSREKAIEYIKNNFDDTEYCAEYDGWKAFVYHDSIEFRIVRLEVQ